MIPGARASGLPAPDAPAARHSARVAAHIHEEIARARGRIPFARFVELALYAPGLGYYSAGARGPGAEGDFVTAPEITPLFARCLARQVADLLGALGGGDVLEAGAGSGALAADLLAALAALGVTPRRYLILERSAGLRARQRERLAATALPAGTRVQWLEALPGPGLRGVVLANELLDALAPTRFTRTDVGVDEWYVRASPEGGFTWELAAPSDPAIYAAVAGIERALGDRLHDGYTSEVGLVQRAWVRSIAGALAAGALLLVDYGYPRREYYHPERDRGTLACFYRHRVHDDPLALPGIQDISAHVDFTAIAEAGAEAGLELAGYTTQAAFLLDCGLLELAAAVPASDPGYPALTARIKRLTLPGEMGELVKVMALTRGLAATGALRGFATLDRRGRL